MPELWATQKAQHHFLLPYPSLIIIYNHHCLIRPYGLCCTLIHFRKRRYKNREYENPLEQLGTLFFRILIYYCATRTYWPEQKSYALRYFGSRS